MEEARMAIKMGRVMRKRKWGRKRRRKRRRKVWMAVGVEGRVMGDAVGR